MNIILLSKIKQYLKKYIEESLVGAGAIKGERGEQGLPGLNGKKGEKGERGERGEPFKYSDFTVSQLASLKGEEGVGLLKIVADGDIMKYVKTDGTIGFVGRMPRGEKGDTPDVTIQATANGIPVPVDESTIGDTNIFRFAFNDIQGASDGKIRIDPTAEPKYISDIIDGTIKIEDGKLSVNSLAGMTVSSSELNFLQGARANIQEQIDNSIRITSVYGVFKNHSALERDKGNPSDGQVAFVRSDELQGGGKTLYVWVQRHASWMPLGGAEILPRNFYTSPINLASETSGILQASKISAEIARARDVLDKNTYGSHVAGAVSKALSLDGQTVTIGQINDSVALSHSHDNLPLIKSLTDKGTGTRFLADDGTYRTAGVPLIRVKVNTPTRYVLTITTAEGSFDTPNLRGAIDYEELALSEEREFIPAVSQTVIQEKLHRALVPETVFEIRETGDNAGIFINGDLAELNDNVMSFKI